MHHLLNVKMSNRPKFIILLINLLLGELLF